MSTHVCPICASTAHDVLKTRVARANAAPIIRCRACRYVYRGESLLPDPPLPTPPMLPVSEIVVRRRIRLLEQWTACGSLLHIGNQDERFARAARVNGWQIAEIDLPQSPSAARQALAEGIWPAGSFDTIVLWRVLERCHHPAEVLRLAAHYCRVDGVLVAETLHADAMLHQQAAPGQGEAPVARLYTNAALMHFLGRYGFRIERVEYEEAAPLAMAESRRLLAPNDRARHEVPRPPARYLRRAAPGWMTVIARYVP